MMRHFVRRSRPLIAIAWRAHENAIAFAFALSLSVIANVTFLCAVDSCPRNEISRKIEFHSLIGISQMNSADSDLVGTPGRANDP
jgi:hypothetical protein